MTAFSAAAPREIAVARRARWAKTKVKYPTPDEVLGRRRRSGQAVEQSAAIGVRGCGYSEEIEAGVEEAKI
jgi:hypothetical protein